MNSAVSTLLRNCLTLLLGCLLVLGPFLHSHLGLSHISGFHVDGVPTHELVSGVSTAVLHTPDQESPAIGVATSLPNSESKFFTGLAFAILLAVLPLLSLSVRAHPLTSQPRAAVGTVYQPGWPPPSLAPPSV